MKCQLQYNLYIYFFVQVEKGVGQDVKFVYLFLTNREPRQIQGEDASSPQVEERRISDDYRGNYKWRVLGKKSAAKRRYDEKDQKCKYFDEINVARMRAEGRVDWYKIRPTVK